MGYFKDHALAAGIPSARPRPEPVLTRLVGADGMLDMHAWGLLSYEARVGYLAALSLIEIRAQASVIAVAARRQVSEIIGAWVAMGYLDARRAAQAMAAEVHP